MSPLLLLAEKKSLNRSPFAELNKTLCSTMGAHLKLHREGINSLCFQKSIKHKLSYCCHHPFIRQTSGTYYFTDNNWVRIVLRRLFFEFDKKQNKELQDWQNHWLLVYNYNTVIMGAVNKIYMISKYEYFLGAEGYDCFQVRNVQVFISHTKKRQEQHFTKQFLQQHFETI